MRNGNGKFLTDKNNAISSSYPTYEEWKLAEPVSGEIRSSRSYPTYEEWKPSHIDLGIRKRTVLILPMRNGNNLMTEIY